MKKTTKNSSAASLSVIGASLAGLAATAYFFLGAEGKKRQKYAKSWAIKMTGDIVGRLEKAKAISEPAYHEIIDSVAIKHQKQMKNANNEIQELASDLKKHWKNISTSAKIAKDDAILVKNTVIRDSKKVIKDIKKEALAPKNKKTATKKK
jgi:hypothetical protein